MHAMTVDLIYTINPSEHDAFQQSEDGETEGSDVPV